jgi:hypothetical protein
MNQFTLSHPSSVTYILILFFHLPLRLPHSLFPLALSITIFRHISAIPPAIHVSHNSNYEAPQYAVFSSLLFTFTSKYSSLKDHLQPTFLHQDEIPTSAVITSNVRKYSFTCCSLSFLYKDAETQNESLH